MATEKAPTPKVRSLEKLLEGQRLKMMAEWELFARSVDHGTSRGSHNESTLRQALRTQLPRKFGIGSGFIENADGRQSTQQDIIIYDAWNNAPLYEGDDWGIYPVEIVRGTIEVKTTLNATNLGETLAAAAELRSLANPQRILVGNVRDSVSHWEHHISEGNVPPRTFIFAYDATGTSVASIAEMLRAASKVHSGAHVHGLCVLKHDVFLRRKPFDKGEYIIEAVDNPFGWRQFLTSLHRTCESLDTPEHVDRDAYLETPLTAVE